MTKKLEIKKGSSNVFKDLGVPGSDVKHLKAQLAAEVIRILDSQKLSVRKAAEQTGFDHADFSRIRNADLARFTIDRLVTILNNLNRHIELKITRLKSA
ncbi:MAG: helix-turn-helix domain-containing protein [Gammaproteobacteria bacterium]|nr:helix-turn-helix domain-containing protein [Gammaproteobacteria bacterium]MDH5614627.1 helix-turn-helix domain-containing protein [Gammaproteobacteria bacterium]